MQHDSWHSRAEYTPRLTAMSTPSTSVLVRMRHALCWQLGGANVSVAEPLRVWLGVLVVVAVLLRVRDAVEVCVLVPVRVPLEVGEMVPVRLAVLLPVAVGVAVEDAVPEAVVVALAVLLAVPLAVAVLLAVPLDVPVLMGVGIVLLYKLATSAAVMAPAYTRTCATMPMK